MEASGEHPWLLDVPIHSFPQTPNILRWLEFGFAALRETGLGDNEKLASLLLVDGFVTATARLTRAAVADTPRTGPPVHLMDAATYPELSRVLGDGAPRDLIFADHGLRFGLDRIKMGIGALIETPAHER